MKLNREQALHCAQYMEDYYHHFDRIDDYMRSQKKTQISCNMHYLASEL